MNMLLLAIFFYVPACELAELGIAADAERVFCLQKHRSEAEAAESPTAAGGNFQNKNIFHFFRSVYV